MVQEHTVQTILNFCPNLHKLGNLLSWSVEPHQVLVTGVIIFISITICPYETEEQHRHNINLCWNSY